VIRLDFEGCGEALRKYGFDPVFGPERLEEPEGIERGPDSRLGIDDAYLVDTPVRVLQNLRKPFAATLLTLSSHHPYHFPGVEAGGSGAHSDYLQSLAHVDRVLRGFLDRMDGAGLLEETLVVIVGDHGESFGEHGMFIHNNSMYEEELGATLVLWAKDGRLKREKAAISRHIDIVPTIAELLDVRNCPSPVQGVGLMDVDARRTSFASSYFPRASLALREGDRKYILFPSNGRLLRFDLESDPGEAAGVAVEDAEEYENVVRRLSFFTAHQDLMFESTESPDAPAGSREGKR